MPHPSLAKNWPLKEIIEEEEIERKLNEKTKIFSPNFTIS